MSQRLILALNAALMLTQLSSICTLYILCCSCENPFATTVFLCFCGFFDGFHDEHWISIGIVWNCRSDIIRFSWFEATGILKVAIDQFQVLSIVHLQPLSKNKQRETTQSKLVSIPTGEKKIMIRTK